MADVESSIGRGGRDDSGALQSGAVVMERHGLATRCERRVAVLEAAVKQQNMLNGGRERKATDRVLGDLHFFRHNSADVSSPMTPTGPSVC